MAGANPVATPGTKLNFQEYEQDAELEKKLQTPFRSAAARSNFLSADCVDVQFAAKEICRHMSTPTESSWKALKRMARYLSGNPDSCTPTDGRKSML